MLPVEELEVGMAQFCGTETYHRISVLSPYFVATDGAKWLAQNADCYWLFDTIAGHQPQCLTDEMLQSIQFWTLKVNADKSATLICERDEGDEFLRQEIDYTDFPLSNVKLYVGVQPLKYGKNLYVAMLPSEY